MSVISHEMLQIFSFTSIWKLQFKLTAAPEAKMSVILIYEAASSGLGVNTSLLHTDVIA